MTKSYKAEMAESMSDAPFTHVRCDSWDYSAHRQFKKADVLTLPTPGLFHPPYRPIASQSISRDVSLARARPF